MAWGTHIVQELDYILSQKGAAAIFIMTIALSLYTLYADEKLFEDLKFNPYSFFKDKQYHTLITSGFIHVDFNHLLFNMLTFYFFAFELEPLIGSINFVILYFSALIISDLHVLFLHKNDPTYSSVGASGAITAVLFASILYEPNMGIGMIFIPLYIPAPVYALIYVGLCIYLNKKDKTSNINHLAHLWGAVSGLILTVIIDPSIINHFLQTIDVASWFDFNGL